jgi:hypothetical protein
MMHAYLLGCVLITGSLKLIVISFRWLTEAMEAQGAMMSWHTSRPVNP